MLSLKLLLIAPLVFAAPAFAQGTQQQAQGVKNRSPNVTTGPRAPVATRPSDNPFQNPIGQSVPPAVSSNPNLNSNQTNALVKGQRISRTSEFAKAIRRQAGVGQSLHDGGTLRASQR